MRVRRFELRLVGSTLVVGWLIAAGLVLVAYRPGGPLDVVVGLTMVIPAVIAMCGVVWPPITRGGWTFAAMVWLGVVAVLCLIPSITGLVEQIQNLGAQTLVPSFEAAYPWLVALGATSLFSGLGLARRLRGGTALRRRRFVDGAIIATILTALSATVFAGAALANEIAVAESGPTRSRFGPTGGDAPPPACDGPIAAGPSARLSTDLELVSDLRSIGSADLRGLRDGTDLRWSAYVATGRQLGQAGAARIGEDAWARPVGGSWRSVPPAAMDDQTVDVQVLATALNPDNRAAAEDRGVDIVEGARARRCRVAVDGETFVAAFPQVRWLVGDADLHRWRGELDYWVFMDGQLGQVVGDVGGEAGGILPDALLGRIDVHLTATGRDGEPVIYPPAR